jgi:hypothetical protein
MNRTDWINLTNAIRLRKQDYSGRDGEVQYKTSFQKIYSSRKYDGDKYGVEISYERCDLEARYKSYALFLHCSYAHEIHHTYQNLERYEFSKVQKSHAKELFIPHVGFGHSVHGALQLGLPNQENGCYHLGFYAAAFFYAFAIQEPRLQLVDREWVIVDSKLGYFDFATYFSYYRTIPIDLPIPKFIDPAGMPVLKLAEGVEIRDPDNKDEFDEEGR